MTIAIVSSGDFNQGTGRAQKTASKGPVFITHQGRPAHVLLSIEDYPRIVGTRRSIVDAPPSRHDEWVDDSKAAEMPSAAMGADRRSYR